MVILIFSSFASAGIREWLRSRITGKASTEQLTNASVTVTGITAVTVQVFNSSLTGATVTPTEDDIVNISFTVQLTDQDGVNDINTSSVNANFSKVGEGLRANSSCTAISGQSTTTAQNFSCTIGMWYFDAPGIWTITAGGNDLGNMTYVYNTTTVFQYAQLQSVKIAPNSLSWASVAPGDSNKSSSNDPTLINNTGNYNVTNLTVKGIHLYGQTDNTKFIAVGNLTVSNNTGSNIECNPSSSTTVPLVNGSYVQIPTAVLSRGNHSANNNQTGQEQFFYCFTAIPSGVSSQIYSTTSGGSWSIKII